MSLKTVAQAHLDAGRSVIPVNVRGDVRYIKTPKFSWTEYSRELPNTIEGWFEDEKNTGLAIVTGQVSNIVVIDIDTKAEDSKLFKQYLADYPTDYVVETRKGYHLYYTYPKIGSVGNSIGKLQEHVDVRGDGGYVVAPPTVINGVPYKLIRDGAFGEFPQELVEVLSTKQKKLSADTSLSEVIIKGFTPNKHNQQLLEFASLMARHGVPSDITRAMCTVLDGRDKTPQGLPQIIKTVDSAYNINAKHSDEQLADMQAVYTMRDLIQMDLRVDWMVRGWFPKSTIGVIGAYSQVGKSVFVMDLAISLAYGLPLFGLYPVENEKQHKVLILQQEDGLVALYEKLWVIERARLKMMPITATADMLDDSILLPQRENIIVPKYTGFNLSDTASMEALRDIIVKHEPDVVIIDPLYTFTKTKEHMVETPELLAHWLRPLRDTLGTSFLIVHHTTKESQKSGDDIDATDLHGSSLLRASLETVIMMRNLSRVQLDEGRAIRFFRHAKVRGTQPPLDLAIHIDGENGAYSVREIDVDMEMAQELTDAETEIYHLVMDHPDMSAAQIAELVSSSASNTRRILKKLVDQNLIEKNGTVYGLPVEFEGDF